MSNFDARRDYDQGRDVRDHTTLLRLLDARSQRGVLWPLVGARRTGKTWALRALESLRIQRGASAKYFDLRRIGATVPELRETSCLLLDEPQFVEQAGVGRDVEVFLRWCEALHESGTVILLAMSPAEWRTLEKFGERRSLVSAQDVRFLSPLSPTQSEALAHTEEAKALLPRLPNNWRRNPFLLELVFQTAEAHPEIVKDVWNLLKAARDQSDRAEFFYFRAVFNNGLTDDQRAAVRDIARGVYNSNSEDIEVLWRSGLLEEHGTGYTIADPVLEANLCPLRIHHVSDIHFGAKSAERVDVKMHKGRSDDLASGTGPRRVCDHYLGHLAELVAAGRAPHLLIISGDIAEYADDAQYEDARAWLTKVCELLASHPRLQPDAPHALLVGGNHDVDWRQTAGPAGSGARRRHVPFARAFEGHPRTLRVRLDDPPAARELAVARYPDVGVEIALLGSSEFGGAEEYDPVREELLALVERLRKSAMEETDADRAATLRGHVARIDPGLVHDADLARVRQRRWEYPVRIAVLHHPVSPLPATELARFTGLINAGEVKDTLVHMEFCLVLHGHVHAGWFGKEQWPERHENWTIRIAAAPSLGSREVQEHNGFNEIEITRNGVGRQVSYEITVHRVVREGATWTRRVSMGPFVPGG